MSKVEETKKRTGNANTGRTGAATEGRTTGKTVRRADGNVGKTVRRADGTVGKAGGSAGKQTGKNGKKRKKKKKKQIKTKKQLVFRIIKYIFFALLIVLIAVGIKCGSVLLKYKHDAEALVDEKGKAAFTESLTTIVYDTYGDELTELSSAKNSYYLKFDEIPYMVKKIFIAIEDRNFYKHSGVDYKAVARAVMELIRNDGEITQGGSTITQQLARGTYLSYEVSFERKVKEVFIARKLEKEYSKDDILEFYINDIYFANGFYGIEAAAKGYFGKSAVDLSLSELAFICSIPNNPTLYDPLNHMENTLKRRDRVLKQIYDQGYIDQSQYQEALNETITLSPEIKTGTNNYVETFVRYSATIELMKQKGFDFKYSFATDEEQEEYQNNYDEVYSECNQMLFTGGYRIYTTIDMGIQDLLQSSLDENLSDSQEKGDDGIYKFQGSATCIDNSTGYVAAIVGGRTQEDYKGYTLNRAYQSFRQPGSSIKPILVYTPLFERDYTPDSTVKDEPIKDGPVNSPNVYSGSISLRYAIKTSKNTVPWNYFEKMGFDTCLDYLLNMGFSHIVKKDYNSATAIGGMTYGVSTYEMALAYATLENEGTYRNPTCIKRIEDSFGDLVLENGNNDKKTKQIYEAKATLMMTDCMKDVLESGTGKNYNVDTAICAAKTGTTNDNKDSWLVGYSRYYTTAVWCGYDMPQEIESDLVKAAGNTWHDFMEALHESLQEKDFESYYGYDDDDDDDDDDDSQETTTAEETTTAAEETTTPEVQTTTVKEPARETTTAAPQETTTKPEETTTHKKEEETTTEKKAEETTSQIVTTAPQISTSASDEKKTDEIVTTLPADAMGNT